MCGVPLPRRRQLHRAPDRARLQGGRLRPGGGPCHGQGAGPARGGAGHHPGHDHRRGVPGRARQQLHPGAVARPARRPGSPIWTFPPAPSA
ncbi:MAG: hypothetical protein MZV70_29045 [Desulfobacterales bacterium]|nr:hypothetical protein [Desulfobacterales bacterium]